MSLMKPLRVTLELGSAIVDAEAPRHFDSLIAWAEVQEALTNGTLTSFEDVHAALPFEKEWRSGEWVWKASVLIEGSRRAPQQRWLSRKFWEQGYGELYGNGMLATGRKGEPGEPTDPGATIPREVHSIKDKRLFKMGAAGGDIDTSRNHQKNAGFLYPVVNIDRMVAFCIGDAQRIEYLLRAHVHTLGKRNRLGHGKVTNVTVDEDVAANEFWSLRVLPWRERSDDVVVESPVRPPYWAKENAIPAFEPLDMGIVAAAGLL